MNFRVTYDKGADAAYIYVREAEPEGGVITVWGSPQGDVLLDYGNGGRLLGIEILDPVQRLGRDLLSMAERIDAEVEP